MANRPPVRTIDWKAAAKAVEEVATAQNLPTNVFPQPEGDSPAVIEREGEGSTRRAAKAANKPSEQAPVPHSPRANFTCVLPLYLIEEIQSRTFHSRPKQTINFTILMALQEAGYHVKPEDLVPDRRRSRQEP